ncbi:MAG: nucleotidyltransferase family protein [Planctomycetota bacterium]|nr:nucleotidyltransferase family protein [Planctomycetaceae bacterium]MDQ3333061.1 nucleotidyltransferase family protein [Planctomycetota bacterium]
MRSQLEESKTIRSATGGSGLAFGSQAELGAYEQKLNANLEWALSEGSRFFEGKGSVHESLRKITQRLDELGISYALAGGMALYQHGFRRFTDDIDILVTRESRQEIQKRLRGLGYRPPFERSKNLRDTETGVKIEFLTAGEFPGDGKPKPIAFPDPHEVAVEIDGIKVLKLDTLIELKLASGISSPDRRKDLGDVQELIKLLTLPKEYAEKLNPYVKPTFEQLWNEVFGQHRRYMTLWRNKWLTSEAKTMDDMISTLRVAADRLQAMKDDGVHLDQNGGTTDDYAYLITYDPAVAKKWGLEDEREYWGDEDDAVDPDDDDK